MRPPAAPLTDALRPAVTPADASWPDVLPSWDRTAGKVVPWRSDPTPAARPWAGPGAHRVRRASGGGVPLPRPTPGRRPSIVALGLVLGIGLWAVFSARVAAGDAPPVEPVPGVSRSPVNALDVADLRRLGRVLLDATVEYELDLPLPPGATPGQRLVVRGMAVAVRDRGRTLLLTASPYLEEGRRVLLLPRGSLGAAATAPSPSPSCQLPSPRGVHGAAAPGVGAGGAGGDGDGARMEEARGGPGGGTLSPVPARLRHVSPQLGLAVVVPDPPPAAAPTGLPGAAALGVAEPLVVTGETASPVRSPPLAFGPPPAGLPPGSAPSAVLVEVLGVGEGEDAFFLRTRAPWSGGVPLTDHQGNLLALCHHAVSGEEGRAVPLAAIRVYLDEVVPAPAPR